ncbi:TraB/GumN family protein [Wenyingzhuangia sp. IMCC45574]
MKRTLFILTCFVTLILQAQEKNSLLWKISGNGLQKDSYLYGTMHVSEKIAFHLDDVFFESLMESDFVALETDPTYWLDFLYKENELNNELKSFLSSSNSNFYNNPFKLEKYKQEQLMFFLSRENMILNGVLYRTSPMALNFQEDTFLDMFIYQSGKKWNKPIYSLEDFERSSYLVKKATSSSSKKKKDLWLQKLLKKQNYYQLMNNAYRDRNISFLDSLNKGFNSESYMDNMLYKRNEEMADNIDKIAKKGSLFSAIGAAHLAGEKGVLQLLRDKGYKVTALISKETLKSKQLKEKIDTKIIDTKFTEQTSLDGFFTGKFPNKLYEIDFLNNTISLCPDLVNGSYVIVTRISTFSGLYKNKLDDIKTNRLLTESIPGEIISKTDIEKDGIKGLNIVNKTKSGDYQQYQIFFTPLEILIFKMAGKKEYVKNHGTQFFNSLKFNNTTSKFKTVTPTYGGFKVDVPSYHSFTNSSNTGNRLLQAIDTNDNYYFVKEVTLNDVNYIEEDNFELKRIQERFYKNHKFEFNENEFTFSQKEKSYTSTSKLNTSLNKYLHLKTYINAGHYYLLGCLSNTDKPNNAFFSSFKLTDFAYPEEKFEIKKDTSLFFTVKSTVKPKFKKTYNHYGNNKKKDYESFTKSATYTSRANESVFVTLEKKHDLVSYKNIDSLWTDISYSPNPISKHLYNNYYDSSSKNFIIDNKVKGKNKNGYYYNYLLKDSLSSKAIKVSHLVSNHVIYTLETLTDTLHKESEFVTQFFTSFTPKDTIIGKPLFKDKTDLFITALKNKDSIVLNSSYLIDFNESQTNKLLKLLKEYEFADNQLNIKKSLIQKIAKFKNKKVQNFLEKTYKSSFDNPNNQFAIASALANQSNQETYKRLLKLFKTDIPLTSSEYNISSLFSKLGDSLQVAKNLYPEVLTYSTISEYKDPIYQLLAKLVEKEIIDPATYKAYKDQIITDAKIELKRQISKKITAKSSNHGYSSSTYYSENDELNNFVKILFPYRKEKNVKEFFTRLDYTDNYYVKSTYVALRLKEDKKLEKKFFKSLLASTGSRGVLFKKLNKINKTDIFPKEYKTKEEVYKSYLFKSNKNNGLKDSIAFIGTRDFKLAKTPYEVYFYKSKPHPNSKSYNKDWKLSYIAFKKEATIGVKSYHKKTNQTLDETKEIDKVLDIETEKIRLKNRKRVNLEEDRYPRY